MPLPRQTRKGLIGWQSHQIFKPRFQMTLIMLLTGLTGFLSSFLLLKAGLDQMWARYPLAILTAYAAFLLLLRLWLALQRWRNDAGGDFGIVFSSGGSGGDPDSPGAEIYGGGGDFGGGGAGGSWGEPVSSSQSSLGGDPLIDGAAGFEFDLEEFGLVILAVVALLGGLFATVYVVYLAPVLLAEILVDAVLLRGLYGRLNHLERRHWLRAVVRRTLLPAVLCALFFGFAGGVFQALAPGAASVGEVWRGLTSGGRESDY